MPETDDAVRLTERHKQLVAAFLAGEERALARAISAVENEAEGFETLLETLHEGVGDARRIGLTGPPGAGKSTITAALARLYRDRGHRVGVIAVDPTSPFTGGALLGDRIRMNELSTEPDIFIRSMASRGSVGGLATAARDTADLMDAFGFSRILLETVGVGQTELQIAGSADTTVVILVPESGDGIQAMKAGLMEVADVFVVNKADRPGADRLRKEIEVMKALRDGAALRGVPAHHGVDLSAIGARRKVDTGPPSGEPRVPEPSWDAPILKTVAPSGVGVEELAAAIDAHLEWLRLGGRLGARRAAGLLDHARAVAERRMLRETEPIFDTRLQEHASELGSGTLSPYTLARRLLAEILPKGLD